MRRALLLLPIALLAAGCGGSDAMEAFHAEARAQGVSVEQADAVAEEMCKITTTDKALALAKDVYQNGRTSEGLVMMLVVSKGIPAHCPERRDVWAGMADKVNSR